MWSKNGETAPTFFPKENQYKIPTSLSETYSRVIDEAVTAAQSGLTDYSSAMRKTMRAISDSGIRTVDYATGYSRRLDTAVRQNVLWGIKQCCIGTAEQIGEEIGADGWEISYHSNPRPSHEEMGGRQYADGDGITVNGKYYPPFSDVADLLQDFNCLHYKFPILLGISEPAYDEEELAAMKENDRRKFEFEGKEYTGYEATQIQRKLETEIRKQKDRANLFAASGDDDGRRAAQEKINLLTKKYKQFSDAAGLPTHKERMSVAKFHHVKTATELKRNQLTKNVGGGIIGEKESSPRKMLKDSDYAVDWSKIQSQEYRERLSALSTNDKAVDSILTRAKRMLNNRNGLKTEELYAVSLRDGREIARITDQSYDSGVKRTPEFTLKLNNADEVKGESILLLHNHPRGLPPSLDDINALLSNKNAAGITVGHDGSIYYYTRPTYEIDEADYKVELVRSIGKKLEGIELQEDTLKELSKRFGFIFKKL